MRARGQAKPHQRMFQQRQQRHRLQAAKRGLRRQTREHAGFGIGQRVAAGVVDGDMPALERGGDTARQCAVGRYQSGVFAGGFDRFAQGHRDGQGFFFGVCSLDHADRSERLCGGFFENLCTAARLPAFSSGGGAQRFRYQELAAVGGGCGNCATS